MPDVNKNMVPLPGSERNALPDAVEIGPADPQEQLKVTVYVRQKGERVDIQKMGKLPPKKRKYLTYDQVVARYGASPADLKRVEDFAKANGLTVVQSNPEHRSIQLSGSVAQMQQAFGTELKKFQHGNKTFRGRVGPLYIPKALKGIVEGVFGLDGRKMAHSYARRPPKAQSVAATAKAALPAGTFLPTQVAALYNFPSNDGTGQTVGILTFNDEGGGYSQAALNAYFTQVLKQASPVITNIVVAGPGNTPSSSTDPANVTDEVMLDAQVVGALVPGANIRMYFSTFTEQGWVDVLTRVAMDPVNVNVLSISYGNPENAKGSAWTAAAINQVTKNFEAAAARGITVCVASGDSGSSDGVTGVHADYPASDPNVLGVGGTRITASGSSITSEVVWDDQEGAGGGGVSTIFPLPTWQNGIKPLAKPAIHQTGRGVPDVAGLADPETGYEIIDVTGKNLETIGGTSASTPLWASLIARINQAIGANVGFFNPLLYGSLSKTLNDITQGNNGRFLAAPGWDACTGWGTPNGTKLLNALKSAK
jgi:kumamolisin